MPFNLSKLNTLNKIIFTLLILISIVIIYNYYQMYLVYQMGEDYDCDDAEHMDATNDMSFSERLSKTADNMQPEVRKHLHGILNNPNSIRTEMEHTEENTDSNNPNSGNSANAASNDVKNNASGSIAGPTISQPDCIPSHTGEITNPSRRDDMININEEINNKQPIDNPGDVSRASDNVESNMDDNPENGKIKLVIYHMRGCGHCEDMVDKKLQNGKTVVENLREIFKNDPQIFVLDFQYQRDPIVAKRGIMAFPTIKMVKPDGAYEYNGRRDVESLANFCIQNKRQ